MNKEKEIAKDINDIFKRGDMTKTAYTFLRAKFISYMGRRIIKHTIEELQNKGIVVVYADTDSCFIKMNGRSIDELKVRQKQ